MDTNNNSKDLGDLESLVKMYKEGFLTEEEFKRAKAKILGDSDTKEETEKVTDELEKGEPESSDNSQENATTGSSKSETPLAPDPSEKTASEKNINTEISDKETNKAASSNTEVKKKKNYKKLYWGIGIVISIISILVIATFIYSKYRSEIRCYLKDGEYCGYAGYWYRYIHVYRAEKFFKMGCELDDPYSCGELGNIYSYVDDLKNEQNAVFFYKKGCSLENAESCDHLALKYAGGFGVEKNKEKAVEFYKKACMFGKRRIDFLSSPCNNAGYEYIYGENVKKDINTAVSLLKKGCNLNFKDDCSSLAFEYDQGTYFPQNKPEAIKYYQKACDLNDPYSCMVLAETYRTDLNYYDIKKSIQLYKKKCEMNKISSEIDCYRAGKYIYYGYENPQNIDKTKAIEYLNKACDEGSAAGCLFLAKIYSGKLDNDKAIEYSNKGCNMGDGPSCTYLGIYFMAKENKYNSFVWAKAKGYFGRGNRLNKEKCFNKNSTLFDIEGRNCYYLAESYDVGIGVKSNKTTARTLYEKACDLKFEKACTEAGKFYLEGDTVKKNPEKANNYFYIGCLMGDADGCVYYKE